jgi:hypothetical protein
MTNLPGTTQSTRDDTDGTETVEKPVGKLGSNYQCTSAPRRAYSATAEFPPSTDTIH